MYGLMTQGHLFPEHRAVVRTCLALFAAVFIAAVILDMLFYHIVGWKPEIATSGTVYYEDHISYHFASWGSFLIFLGMAVALLYKTLRYIVPRKTHGIVPRYIFTIMAIGGIFIFAGAVSVTFSGNLHIPAALRPAGALAAFDMLYLAGALGLSDAVLFWRARKLAR